MSLNGRLDHFKALHEMFFDEVADSLKTPADIRPRAAMFFPMHIGCRDQGAFEYTAMENAEHAAEYMADPVLGAGMERLCGILLELDADTFVWEMPAALYRRIWACMTLFDHVCPDGIFAKVLEKFYDGMRHDETEDILEGNACAGEAVCDDDIPEGCVYRAGRFTFYTLGSFSSGRTNYANAMRVRSLDDGDAQSHDGENVPKHDDENVPKHDDGDV